MPSTRPVIAIRTDDDTVRKFKYICKNESRSTSNKGELLIKECIKAYEAEHGEIEIEEGQD